MKKYLIELLVIFVGISASFLVDEYRENIEIDRQVEKSLHSLKAELNSDLRNLKSLIANIDSTDKHFSYILNFSSTSFIDKIVLDKAWQAVTTPRGGKLSLSVYSAMEASGIIYKIDNDSIRTDILDLYQNWYEKYHNVIDYDLIHIQKMDDIILKNFILLTDNKSWNLDWSIDSNIKEMLSNNELRNYIAANRGTKSIMKGRANKLIERIQNAISLIDKF
ncbi:hypothetical protein N9C41_02555 [Candidatus Marinimicrobia bacterium]|jgi:hypothetical protein|nr:hypothetical protein [Candidatus Neomarinimicrobiota bacterium]|tara:strand:+ start:890 stop:1552 length:663 start_codon:yes stop_codon:yes gene_type:complete